MPLHLHMYTKKQTKNKGSTPVQKLVSVGFHIIISKELPIFQTVCYD